MAFGSNFPGLSFHISSFCCEFNIFMKVHLGSNNAMKMAAYRFSTSVVNPLSFIWKLQMMTFGIDKIWNLFWWEGECRSIHILIVRQRNYFIFVLLFYYQLLVTLNLLFFNIIMWFHKISFLLPIWTNLHQSRLALSILYSRADKRGTLQTTLQRLAGKLREKRREGIQLVLHV